MKCYNKYYCLSNEDINDQSHRFHVGDLWDEMGSLQFEFMKNTGGLKPDQKLMDLACGSFRGGVYFIEYLNSRNYYGHDISEPLVKAGFEKEIVPNNLDSKFDLGNVSINADFDFSKFEGVKFDKVVSISLFSHLPKKHFVKAMKNLRNYTHKYSEVYISFFLVNDKGYGGPYVHNSGAGVTTYPDQDPYHYTWGQIQSVAEISGYDVVMCPDPGFPRKQLIAKFTPCEM